MCVLGIKLRCSCLHSKGSHPLNHLSSAKAKASSKAGHLTSTCAWKYVSFFTVDSIWGYGYPCADTLFALRKQGLYYYCYGFIMEGLYSLERALIYSIRLDSYKRGFWKVVKSLSKGKYRDYSEVGTWRSGELPVKSNLGKKIAQQPYVDSSSIEKQ